MILQLRGLVVGMAFGGMVWHDMNIACTHPLMHAGGTMVRTSGCGGLLRSGAAVAWPASVVEIVQYPHQPSTKSETRW